MNDPTATTELEALADDVRSWDGTAAQAQVLRGRLRALPAPRGAAAGLGAQVLSKAAACYRKRNGAALAQWLRERADGACFAGPFIGDEAAGPWPFHDALHIDDDTAILWLDCFATVPVVVDARVRDFVRVMWRTRTRPTWVAASRAFAALAARDDVLRDELRGLWTRWFGAGWPIRWEHDRLHAAPPPLSSAAAADSATRHDDDDAAHIVRHLLHLGCAWLARGGDPGVVGGVVAEQVVRTRVPCADDSDASAYLLGLAELLNGAGRAAVLRDLPARLTEVGPGAQAVAALRVIADALPRGQATAVDACREAVLTRLTAVSWQDAPRAVQIEALLETLATARWLRERGEQGALTALRRAVGTADRALQLALRDATPSALFDDPVAAVVERLRRFVDPLLRDTLLPARYAPFFAELVELVGHPELAGVDWPKVVERALGREPATRATPGTIGAVAYDDLLVMVAEAAFPVVSLMRTARLSREATLRLAALGDAGMPQQVAVQVERLLRLARDPEAQLRLLWDALRRDPSSKTFRQLRLVLRGRSTPLHDLVSALADLDAARNVEHVEALRGPVSALIAAASALLVPGADAAPPSAVQHLAGVSHAVEDALRARPDLALRGAEAAAGPRPSSSPRDTIEVLRQMLLGQDGAGGLVGWAAWLDAAGDSEVTLRARMVTELARLEQAVAAAGDAIPVVGDDEHQAVGDAVAALRHELGLFGWPEGLIAARLLDDIVTWSAAQLRAGHKGRVITAHVRAALDRGDDDEAMKVATDAERRSLLPAAVARQLHRFLLERLHLRSAGGLRKALADRVQLPHVVAHLAPLVAGVVAGAFLVLDVGNAWLGLVPTEGTGLNIAITIGLTALGSYAILLADLAYGRRPRRGANGTRGRGWGAAWRVGVVWLVAWFVALVSSFILMVTLGELTDLGAADVMTKLLLWSALALFLGMFLGLVLQGRRTRRDES